MSLHSVVISGGGTGGHIYPALAIADEIKRRYPECKIHFVGAEGRMEMEKVPAAGYPIQGLWITGIERKIFSKKNLLFPFRIISSLAKAGKILKQHQPQIAVGVGGFASGPLLYRAAGRKIPILIQEQNSFPGITNRLLAKKALRICTGFPDMERWFPKERITLTGNPLRAGMLQMEGKRNDAIKHFGLDPEKKTLFIMGGSLGARSMNDATKAAAEQWGENGIQVLWQTGQRFFETNDAFAKQAKHTHVVVLGFIDRMDLAYAAADSIVSRAGAMSISELALVGKPTIFVPSPHVSEDHQTKNAKSLTDRNAALLVTDKEVVNTLGKTAQELLLNVELCATLSAAIKAQAKPNAASEVVDEIEKLVS